MGYIQHAHQEVHVVLYISGETEEPAPVHEASKDSNHAVGQSPYQTCPNGTLDAESEIETRDKMSKINFPYKKSSPDTAHGQ